MAIALRGVSVTRHPSLPTVPVGTTTDDLVLVVCHGQLNAVGNGPSVAGFTLVSLTTSGGGGVGRYVAIFAKRATGPESGSYTVSIAGTSTVGMSEAYSFTGVAKIGNGYDQTNGLFASALSTATPAVSLSGLPAGAYLLWTIATNGATPTVTSPGGWTEISPTAASSLHTLGQTAGAAATGSLSTTMSASSTNRNAAIISLIPDSPASNVTPVAAVTAAGAAGVATTASNVNTTAAVTSGGVRGVVAAATVAVAASITAAGVVGSASDTSTITTTTIVAAGSTGTSTTGSTTATAAITAAGVAGTTKSATVPIVATITSSGSLGTGTAADVGTVATITASGDIGASPQAPATLNAAATITSTGTIGKTSSTSVPATVTITATGQLGLASSATLTITTTVTATGIIPSTRDVTVLSVTEIRRTVTFGWDTGTTYGEGAYGSDTYGSIPPPRPVTVTEVDRPIRIEYRP